MYKTKNELLKEKFEEVDYYKNLLMIHKKTDHLDLVVEILKKLLSQIDLIRDLPEDEEIIIQKSDGTRGTASRREFTIEELSTFDGKDGRLAYVAVNGKVYDVSTEKTWGGATHFGLYAGRDLSIEYTSCHMNSEALSKLNIVGVLKK